jgi:hypothetical protein
MLWHAFLVPAGQHLLSASEHCLVKLILCAEVVRSGLHSLRGCLNVLASDVGGWLQLMLGQCVCFLGSAAPTSQQ